jgi:hypothetical protein
MKRAQSLSLNTIIIAALALLVLVIISVIFMQRMGWFNKKANDCKSVQADGCDFGSVCPDGRYSSVDKVCYNGNEADPYTKCCVPLTR